MNKGVFRVCYIPRKDATQWREIARYSSKKDAVEFMEIYGGANPHLKDELFVLDKKNNCVGRIKEE